MKYLRIVPRIWFNHASYQALSQMRGLLYEHSGHLKEWAVGKTDSTRRIQIHDKLSRTSSTKNFSTSSTVFALTFFTSSNASSGEPSPQGSSEVVSPMVGAKLCVDPLLSNAAISEKYLTHSSVLHPMGSPNAGIAVHTSFFQFGLHSTIRVDFSRCARTRRSHNSPK